MLPANTPIIMPPKSASGKSGIAATIPPVTSDGEDFIESNPRPINPPPKAPNQIHPKGFPIGFDPPSIILILLM